MSVLKDPTKNVIVGAAVSQGMDTKGLAKRAGMKESTFYSRLASPSTFRLDELRTIVRVTHLTDEEILTIVRGNKK